MSSIYRARTHAAALLIVATAGTSTVALLGAGAASAQEPRAVPATTSSAPASTVYFIQAVPGDSVEVSVDGDVVVDTLDSATVSDAVSVEPGSHTITFSSDTWSVDSSVTIGSGSEDVVAHLPADTGADPVITVFDNDLKPVRQGHGRLTVAHTAVVPPADVRASGEVLFSNIANGEFVNADVPSDTYKVDVVPTGGKKALLGPVKLDVKAGSLTRVFAIGQPGKNTMQAVVQVLPVNERKVKAPTKVDTGEAGLVAQPASNVGDFGTVSGEMAGSSLTSPALLAGLAGLAGLGALMLVGRRRRLARV